MTSTPSPDGIAGPFLSDVRTESRRLPSTIRDRGRAYLREGRVGPLEIRPDRVSAAVRGTRTYRTSWTWDGQIATPRCTCPAGPWCKHAFALAAAMEDSANDRAAVARPPRERSPWNPPPGEGADAAVASDLAEWARRRNEPHDRSLRVVAGVDDGFDGDPAVWIEVRLTGPHLRDAPRSRRHLQSLASELAMNRAILAPPHARLLLLLSRLLPESRGFDETRIALGAGALNRLLDSFSGSPLVTWDEAAEDAPRGGVTPGARLRLGDVPVDLVPVSAGEGPAPRLTLAARWPDGATATLDEFVFLGSEDELNPSLVLHHGAFWRVAEAPPAHVVRRMVAGGGLDMPKSGRERFVRALAEGFSDVSGALGSHMIVHRARPLVTLELGLDDWLHVRLFAHTAGADWVPGAPAGPGVAFELDAQGEWIRIPDPGPALELREELTELAAASGADAAPPGADPGPAPGPAGDPADPAGAETGAEDPGDVAPEARDVWVEVPDPEPLEPVREWLASLPFAHGGARLAKRKARDPQLAERGAWIFLGPNKVNEVATAWARRPGGVRYLGNALARGLLAGPRLVRTRVSVTSSGVDFFTISAEWRAEGMSLTEADLARLRGSRSRFVKLSGGWVGRDVVDSLDAEAGLLADLGIAVGEGEQRVTLAQLAQARPESLDALDGMGADPATLGEVRRLREAVRSFKGLPRVPVPARLKAKLRPYQREGLDFLAFVTGLGLGAVLADDMGLGKTVQALAWIEWLRERDPDGGPVLVVCPASVVHNWQRESERFTPHLRVLELASGEERHTLRREVPEHDLVVTNYALFRRDIEHWRKIPLRAAILDEAQNVKNPKAAVSRAALELDARHRLALTGTPIENRALDLWSIMNFVNPGYLGRRSDFVARYDHPEAPPFARRLLAARLRPVLVRRLKEQVARDLPDRIEERLECDLTSGQRKLYLAELMRGRESLERLKRAPGGLERGRIEVLALLTRLRQVCCHPALVGGREDLGSGKFDALFELLEPILAEGRKVLLFSQFVECLKLIESAMRQRGIRHHVLTGATTRRERVVGAFETDPEPCVFLISLKAGGTGLNLTAAQYVILFDPWWNPAVEAQAIDRTHRIGQTRTVIAYRLMAAGTVEEKIWELQRRKQRLVKEVLGEDGFARTLKPEDLDYLLG